MHFDTSERKKTFAQRDSMTELRSQKHIKSTPKATARTLVTFTHILHLFFTILNSLKIKHLENCFL